MSPRDPIDQATRAWLDSIEEGQPPDDDPWDAPYRDVLAGEIETNDNE